MFELPVVQFRVSNEKEWSGFDVRYGFEGDCGAGDRSHHSHSNTPTTAPPNPRYACYWLDSCRGDHELNQCTHWRNELRGKLGIYYSPSGIYKRFSEDRISGVKLQFNPTGCTTVHLLVFNDNRDILFGMKWCHEKHDDDDDRRLLLTFPSAKPRKQGEYGLPIAQRAFQWLSEDNKLSEGLKKRFLYQHANVIYPCHLTNDQATSLTKTFTTNEELLSLHWFPLTKVLENLPVWNNYLLSKEKPNELAQIDGIQPMEVKLGEECRLWSVITRSLMCIREHVPGGFEEFLKV
ncbi:unnamed protein product [Didymodactylos carnosus]|uniref:Uncharacterized protein n=1 Tax=Didymodactylos carnosus TaxID=1234261 RepID=A0A813QIH3_9BILA|nr:unnamed protein product [Didymodactylos carnosus]CAF1086826.1 unnamed protein product [Didymodactylos carnosus]CAF3549699.1 unnamed protein product [Didymodactylos carnosus]CAF3849168.1 unnamed protein product [Didymodactylos carnosus]